MSMNVSYVIYGAGGHAKVIIDLINDLGSEVKCVFDDGDHSEGATFLGIPVKNYDADLHPESKMIIAIGNNKFRHKLSSRIKHEFAILIHPRAFVSKLAKIGEGTVILGNATIQAEALIGQHVIVNAGACVDHEAVVKDFVHVGPGSYIGGAAIVSESVIIAPLSVIMRNAIISENLTTDPLSFIC